MDRQERNANWMALLLTAVVTALTIWILWNASAQAKGKPEGQRAVLVSSREEEHGHV